MTLRLLAALGLLLATPAAGQTQSATPDMTGPAAQANLQALSSGAPAVVPTGSPETIGSPYADKRWLLASLVLNNALPLAPVPLKYDVLEHRLLMRALPPLPDSLVVDDHLVVSFVLTEPATTTAPARRRTFRRFAEAPFLTQRADYVEVLHQGRYILLKHHIRTLLPADYQGAYSSGRRFDEIADKSVYYLHTPAAGLVPVKLTAKALQVAAPELAAGLKKAGRAPQTEAEWAAVLDAADPVAPK